MRLKLVAAGTRMPGWVRDGVDDYAARMPGNCRIEVIEIPVARRGTRQDPARALEKEAKKMLAVPKPGDHVVALEVDGRQLDSEGLARRLERWIRAGGDVVFLIGGPDGLGPGCRERAGFVWSLSKLTLPHALVRVVLAEQLYRANAILANHPYHRA